MRRGYDQPELARRGSRRLLRGMLMYGLNNGSVLTLSREECLRLLRIYNWNKGINPKHCGKLAIDACLPSISAGIE